MRPLYRALAATLLCVLPLSPPGDAAPAAPGAAESRGGRCAGVETEVAAIDRVWSGHPVAFALLTQGPHQFVAYFDADRQMSFAHRRRPGGWSYRKVDSWLGWDSHNYVTLGLDAAGHLHAAGNLHNDPLVYFRATEPFSVRSLERLTALVDPAAERRVSYPRFLAAPDGGLVFNYRDGRSGAGADVYSVYDASHRRWSRLLDTPLIDGEGKRSAYAEGPYRGPDGIYHLAWVWRDTSDAATTHHLSYARSRDLVHWTTSSGSPMTLPITLDRAEIVDPVPPGGGLINNNVRLGVDAEGRPLIAYSRYDVHGDTQLYVARREAAGWRSVQVTDWAGYRWDFGGGGTLIFEVELLTGPHVLDGETLGLAMRRQGRSALLHLDPRTLARRRQISYRHHPPALEAWRTTAAAAPTGEALELRVGPDLGGADEPGVSYYLTWETLPSHRDRPRPSIPPPSTLRLHRLESGAEGCP